MNSIIEQDCPFCGKTPIRYNPEIRTCNNKECKIYDLDIKKEIWNKRFKNEAENN